MGAQCSTILSKSVIVRFGKRSAGRNRRSSITAGDGSGMRFKSSKKSTGCKVLLLGTAESGKSTLAKQMKFLYGNSSASGGSSQSTQSSASRRFTQSELQKYRQVIRKNLVESIRSLFELVDLLQLPAVKQSPIKLLKDRIAGRLEELQAGEGDENEQQVMAFLQSSFSPAEEKELSEHIAVVQLIMQIWSQPAVKGAIIQQSPEDITLPDSTEYWMESLERIVQQKYQPTEQDLLRLNQRSTEIVELRLALEQLYLNLYDMGGLRNERKRWINTFEGVTAVIFVASLSDYDQPLAEDPSQNRLAESLELFENISNSKWFAKSAVILLLNKADVFAKKLKYSPLENYFPEFAGGDDYGKACKFILWRFQQVNRANLTIYPHVTVAVDTAQVRPILIEMKAILFKSTIKMSAAIGK